MTKLVVVKAILPLVPPQVVGLLIVPPKSVGEEGFVSVLGEGSVPVQPLLTMVKLL